MSLRNRLEKAMSPQSVAEADENSAPGSVEVVTKDVHETIDQLEAKKTSLESGVVTLGTLSESIAAMKSCYSDTRTDLEGILADFREPLAKKGVTNLDELIKNHSDDTEVQDYLFAKQNLEEGITQFNTTAQALSAEVPEFDFEPISIDSIESLDLNDVNAPIEKVKSLINEIGIELVELAQQTPEAKERESKIEGYKSKIEAEGVEVLPDDALSKVPYSVIRNTKLIKFACLEHVSPDDMALFGEAVLRAHSGRIGELVEAKYNADCLQYGKSIANKENISRDAYKKMERKIKHDLTEDQIEKMEKSIPDIKEMVTRSERSRAVITQAQTGLESLTRQSLNFQSISGLSIKIDANGGALNISLDTLPSDPGLTTMKQEQANLRQENSGAEAELTSLKNSVPMFIGREAHMAKIQAVNIKLDGIRDKFGNLDKSIEARERELQESANEQCDRLSTLLGSMGISDDTRLLAAKSTDQLLLIAKEVLSEKANSGLNSDDQGKVNRYLSLKADLQALK
jgi:hypothetical protein